MYFLCPIYLEKPHLHMGKKDGPTAGIAFINGVKNSCDLH
jgi:hypothetical protein